ncbi:restriction endonuclease subunit S [Limosilactobacillus reuteri]|uniref:restriction endonuclease subunit S n=1 Tax=Limosilactobacillus reuteri TaxID=1598 RepID=UPI002073B2B0|nr:restriction endonuclease subunit S [Limosilactobacillus reuteri]
MMADTKRQVPNLRFKGFTDDWEQRKLGEMVERETCQVISSDNNPSVEYDDVVSEQGKLNKDVLAKRSVKKGIQFNKNHILYGKLRPYLHNWLNPNFKGVAVGDWWVLKPKNDIKKAFLYALIQTQRYDNVANISTGSKMPRADWNLVSNTNFAIPSQLDEQLKIGEVFSQLDSLIALHQRKLDTLNALKKALLQKMFADKDSKQPVLRFKGFHDDWEQRKLKDVVEKQIKGKAQFEKLAPGEVEYLDTSRLNGGQAILTNGLKDVTLDDILILWDGSKAGTVYHGFEGALGSTLKAYRTSANSKFVYQYLKRHQDNIYNNYRTPNIPHVQKDFLNVFTISVPVSDEQEKIGSFFQQLDNTIVLQHQKLAKYQLVKKSLLQQMLI